MLDGISKNIDTPESEMLLDDFIKDLKTGKVDSSKVEPIRTVNINRKIYTLDNRRLYAYQQAGLKSIPTKEVSLKDPEIAKEFGKKFTTPKKVDGRTARVRR